jgi:peroxiredoxin
MKAIHADNTGIWTQVCELSDNNTVSALYGVKAIPQTFLIDPQGKIIGVNLRGESLNKKLAEIFE